MIIDRDKKGRFIKGHIGMKGDLNPAKRPEVKEKISKNKKTSYKIGKTIPYWKDKKRDIKTNKKISRTLKGRLSPMKGKKQTSDTIQKIKKSNLGLKRNEKTKIKNRINRQNQILKNGGGPNIGKHEIYILDELEKLFNYKIIRQKEVEGYFLDGYIPELNLCIEVDEYAHKHKIEKDKLRENIIQKKLNCKFLRIEDRY
jgi:very-short-patch-repair endonuclease